MSIARTPLLTLSLCLGGILCILPRSAASIELFTFPDGSTCHICDSLGSIFSGLYDCVLGDLESMASLYCHAPDGGCVGKYYPDGYSYDASTPRVITSINKCIYESYDYTYCTLDPSSPDYLTTYKVEDCCFKPGSQVCISNFRVPYTTGG